MCRMPEGNAILMENSTSGAALTATCPGAQPLLGLSAAQGQQLMLVLARYWRQTNELVETRAP